MSYEAVTIRTSAALRRVLEARARVQGKTLSEVARAILQRSLEECPPQQRTSHLRGRLDLRAQPEGWRRVLRERNWRP